MHTITEIPVGTTFQPPYAQWSAALFNGESLTRLVHFGAQITSQLEDGFPAKAKNITQLTGDTIQHLQQKGGLVISGSPIDHEQFIARHNKGVSQHDWILIGKRLQQVKSVAPLVFTPVAPVLEHGKVNFTFDPYSFIAAGAGGVVATEEHLLIKQPFSEHGHIIDGAKVTIAEYRDAKWVPLFTDKKVVEFDLSQWNNDFAIRHRQGARYLTLQNDTSSFGANLPYLLSAVRVNYALGAFNLAPSSPTVDPFDL